jgi:hypothetical protein
MGPVVLFIDLRFLVQIATIQTRPSNCRRFSFTRPSAAMVASLSANVSNPDLTPDTRAFIVSSAKMHLGVSLAVCIVLTNMRPGFKPNQYQARFYA